MSFIPGDGTIDRINNMFGFSEAVPFSRIADKDGVNTYIFQSHKILLCFCYGHVRIIFAVNQQGGSVNIRNML